MSPIWRKIMWGVPVSLSVLCRHWETSWHIMSWLSSLSFNPWCSQIGRLHVPEVSSFFTEGTPPKISKKGFQSKTILGTRSVKQETADPETNLFTGKPSRINVDQWIQPVNPSETIAEIVSMSKVHWDRSWRFIHCWELLRTVQNAQVLKFLDCGTMKPRSGRRNSGNGPCHRPKRHVWNWS